MKPKLVFISSKTKLRMLRKRLMENGMQFKLILVDSHNKVSGFDAESLKPYQEQVKKENNYWDIAREWMDDWNRETQFYKKVMYEGFSLWWLERWAFSKWLIGILPDIDAIKEVIEKTNPAQVLLIEVGDYWQDVIQCVAAHFSLPVAVVSKGRTFARIPRYIDLLKKALPLLTVMGLRTIQGVLRRTRGRLARASENRIKILMLTSSLSWQKLKGYMEGKPKYLDAQLGLVLRELLKRNVKVVALDEMRLSYPKECLKTFLQKKYPYIPMEGYYVTYLFKTFVKGRESKHGSVNDIYKSMKENFQQSNTYKEINLSSLLDKKSKQLTFFSPVSMIELCKSILNKEKPDAIVITVEYGLPGQSFIVAAKAQGIPIIGVQHGIIHEWHSGYVYPKDVDKETIPMPSKMAVFGDYYKEIMTKQSVYRESEVEVTGQSRLDFITKRASQGQDSTLPHLPIDKKIILFTSQPGIEQMAASLLMEGLSQLGDNYFLVIKLHPGEGENLAEPFYEAARRYKVENFMVVKQVDLYELLALCDLHIGVQSTVISEAVVFGKPNLILNTPGSLDSGRWREQGVALNISDFASFKQAVETILEDKETRERLHKARENYIQRHYYRLDGKATERICNLILSQVRGKWRLLKARNGGCS